MDSLIDMRYACSQISLPACSILFRNTVHAKYPGRAISILGINLYSPYTIMLLVLNIVLTISLINRTQVKYSFPARREMLLFLRVYLGAQVFDLALCSGLIKTSWKAIYSALVSFQVACTTTCFVSAMCTGLVWMLPNRVASSCSKIAYLFTVCSLFSSFFLCLLSITSGLGVGLFALLYLVPLFFGTMFVFTQLSKLKILNADIWDYGSLLVTASLAVCIGCTPFVLGMVVVIISDRYLDGTFLIHTLALFAVIKMYGIWSMDKEQEIECVNTVKQ
ncbi:uncharacterized protein NEMAJ01_0339 [Nematocida major]|uniref:uncharacterized protein n=1 Tax=Nematocida major TaxID=1912982 RepID=UPI0020087285|nr:uncharacterized protein NEMAJ01_0339 [Nematocida major]KAH9385443.1 hypothetical protein NEMAJ01_0339 [Nematocida major]